jgi:hypothetical protein
MSINQYQAALQYNAVASEAITAGYAVNLEPTVSITGQAPLCELVESGDAALGIAMNTAASGDPVAICAIGIGPAFVTGHASLTAAGMALKPSTTTDGYLMIATDGDENCCARTLYPITTVATTEQMVQILPRFVAE